MFGARGFNYWFPLLINLVSEPSKVLIVDSFSLAADWHSLILYGKKL